VCPLCVYCVTSYICVLLYMCPPIYVYIIVDRTHRGRSRSLLCVLLVPETLKYICVYYRGAKLN